MAQVVKIVVDDDGQKVDDPVWCYIANYSDAERTLCKGEVFGYGEGRAVFHTKTGKITCPDCIRIIKEIKAIRL